MATESGVRKHTTLPCSYFLGQISIIISSSVFISLIMPRLGIDLCKLSEAHRTFLKKDLFLFL